MSVYPGVVQSVGIGADMGTPPPRTAPQPFQRLQITWHGADGSIWDLSRPSSGVFTSKAGLEGLSWPTFELGTSASQIRAGRRRRSVRVTERSATVPIWVIADSTGEFQDRWARFQASWHPLVPGTLVVQAPGRPARSLQLYFDHDDEGDSYAEDPFYRGAVKMAVKATAEDRPYWEGAPIPGLWTSGNPEPFYGADGNLHIADTAGFVGAALANPGDVAAWPVWEVTNTEPTAPITASITVDGGTITTPPIDAGHTLTITTEIGRARLADGTDVAGQLNPYDARPIPAGKASPLTLAMSGFGTVGVTVVPRYWRAFA